MLDLRDKRNIFSSCLPRKAPCMIRVPIYCSRPPPTVTKLHSIASIAPSIAASHSARVWSGFSSLCCQSLSVCSSVAWPSTRTFRGGWAGPVSCDTNRCSAPKLSLLRRVGRADGGELAAAAAAAISSTGSMNRMERTLLLDFSNFRSLRSASP